MLRLKHVWFVHRRVIKQEAAEWAGVTIFLATVLYVARIISEVL